MRIQISLADWPTAFTSVSKYIGRHWPAGKLSLTTAQETTAILFGYSSVHQLKSELVPEIVVKQSVSIDEMARSMNMIALIKFGFHPEILSNLFRKIPWRKLSVWEKTSDAAELKLKEEYKQKGIMLVDDEYHYYVNYRTSEAFIKLYDEAKIPPFDYAVSNAGNIYRSGYLHDLISLIPTESELAELDLAGSQDDFINSYIVPLIWRPLDDSLGRTNYKNVWEWKMPAFVYLENIGENKYALYHKGLNAYYHGVYDSDQLRAALKSIYLNLPVEQTPVDGSLVGKKKDLIFSWDIPATEEGTLLENGEPIMIDGQAFIRAFPVNSYELNLAHPWLNKLFEIFHFNPACKIHSSVLKDGIEHDHLRLTKLFDRGADEYFKEKLEKNNYSKIERIIAYFFEGTYIDISSIQAAGDLLPEREEWMDEEDFASEIISNDEKIKRLTLIGSNLKMVYREFSLYFDDVAFGYFYEERFCGGDDSTDSIRELPFVTYLLGKQISKKYSINGYSETLTLALLSDLADQKLLLSDAAKALAAGIELWTKHKAQDESIKRMRAYADFIATANPSFLTHGEVYQVTRRSTGEAYREIAKACRSISSYVFQQQPIEALTTSNKNPLPSIAKLLGRTVDTDKNINNN